MTAPQYDTVIVGAGFSGIGTAIKLDKAGMGNYLVIEAGDGPGGTWHWNTYPGIAVDIPSFSYQFSFEQSPNWTRSYAPGRELKAYAEHCVDKYGLRRKIRFNTKVLGASFDDADDLWRVDLDNGDSVTARFLVNASGVLITPNMPDIDGVDSFAGVTHAARPRTRPSTRTGSRMARSRASRRPIAATTGRAGSCAPDPARCAAGCANRSARSAIEPRALGSRLGSCHPWCTMRHGRRVRGPLRDALLAREWY